MTISDYPVRKNLGITEDMATRLAEVSERRSMKEPTLMREFLEDGLSSWEAAQAKKDEGDE